MRNEYYLAIVISAVATTLALSQNPVLAQVPPSAGITGVAVSPPDAAAAPGYWIDGINLSGQVEGGISLNPAEPKLNFGRTFTNRANQPVLNQLMLNANKPLSPDPSHFDWGFQLQFLYGSDARFANFLGELDKALPSQDLNQITVLNANVLLHLPVWFKGGIDIKAGQYPTPLGYESINPSLNPFYSHSYIFSFGLPFTSTGILTTSHINPLLDVYLGADTGENTSIGPYGDDNGAVAFVGGFGLNLLDDNLTIVALTHIGPENPTRTLSPEGFNANAFYRYLNDIVVTYKANSKLSFTTEANLERDDFLGRGASGKPASANAFGVAQYISYTLTDSVTLNGRAEVYRDDNDVFVAAFPGNFDYVNAESGLPNTSYAAPRPTTYAEMTLGVTYKPDWAPAISGLLLRPEIRYDRSLGDTHPFNQGKDNASFTAASDFVLPF